MPTVLVALFIVVVSALNAFGQSEAPRSDVVGCSRATRTQPGVGNAFRGGITNEDYAFSARIPDGLTGWGGVAQNAPFHGFTIFLDSQRRTCIVFEIHVRIDEDEAPRRPSYANAISLGRAQAWQSFRSGTVGGLGIANITTSFSVKMPNRIDDGEILLVTPTSSLGKTREAYDKFVKSIRFDE